MARATHVAVAGGAVADDALAIDLLDLAGLERVQHAVLLGHAADPAVALDAHSRVFPGVKAAILTGRRRDRARLNRLAATP